MGKVNEAIKTFNASIRTFLATVVLGALAYASYFGYSEYNKRERALALANVKVSELTSELKVKTEQLDKLETSLRLLKTDQRLARLDVLSLQRDGDDNVVSSRLQFVELSPKGDPISPPKHFELPGDVIYLDNWVIKFDDEYVEQADIQRGTSLCLFRRIFSEEQKPTEGVSLDEVGMRPQAYGRGQMSAFERDLWKDFWEFANDPAQAAKMGIRAANGEAVSIKVREGKSYAIELRASGGLSIRPLESSPVEKEGT